MIGGRLLSPSGGRSIGRHLAPSAELIDEQPAHPLMRGYSVGNIHTPQAGVIDRDTPTPSGGDTRGVSCPSRQVEILGNSCKTLLNGYHARRENWDYAMLNRPSLPR